MNVDAEKLSAYDGCPRRSVWQERYQLPRISVVGALYRALDAGLKASEHPDRAAENQFMSLAARPGLAVVGRDVYSLAVHHAKLAAIVTLALRSAFRGPWSVFPAQDEVKVAQEEISWRSGLYDAGNGIPRRIVLVDRWSDERRATELRSWRTLGETSILQRPILVTAVTIGASKDGRRHSAWTKCYRHPRNKVFRFKRKNGHEDFGANWNIEWRENSGIPVEDWLTQMRKDDAIAEHVQTEEAPQHPRSAAFRMEIGRMVHEMKRWKERSDSPPMRLSGCYAFTPCPFLDVCYGIRGATPDVYGFVPKISSAPPSRPDAPLPSGTPRISPPHSPESQDRPGLG